jgi:Flp pilus assembly protein TadG
VRQAAVNDSKPVAPRFPQGKIKAFYLLVKSWSRRFRWYERTCGRIPEQDAFGMLKHLAKRSRRYARHFSRFGRARHGATAVEFALIAPAFIALMVALLQTMVVLFAQQALQAGAMEAARLFLTGQAQNSNSGAGLTSSQLLSQICPMMQPLINCTSLNVNVASYTSFSSASTTPPTLTFNGAGQITNTFTYTPGTPGQVMVIELIYPMSAVSGPLGFTLANLPNGMTEIVGVSAFKVEPY